MRVYMSVGAPYSLEIRFSAPGHANRASLLPGSLHTSPTEVGFDATDYGDAFSAFLCLLTLASTFNEHRQ